MPRRLTNAVSHGASYQSNAYRAFGDAQHYSAHGALHIYSLMSFATVHLRGTCVAQIDAGLNEDES